MNPAVLFVVGGTEDTCLVETFDLLQDWWRQEGLSEVNLTDDIKLTPSPINKQQFAGMFQLTCQG